MACAGGRGAAVVRYGALAAVLGGILWVVKFAVIALRDDNFEPLEGVVFVGGLLGIVAGGVALAALLTRGKAGWLQAGLFLLLLAAAVVGSMLFQLGVQAAVNAAFDPDNVGFSEEAGILAVGLVWLALGLALRSRGRHRTRQG